VRGFELENVNKRHLSLALSPNSVGGEGEKWCGCQVTPPGDLAVETPGARRRGLSKGESVDRLGLEFVMVTKTDKEARPKRTKRISRTGAESAPEPAAKPGADISLPTADALALIAANVAKGIDLEPRLAVDYALKLWNCAREKLAGEIKAPSPIAKAAASIAEEPAPAPKEPAPVANSPAPAPRDVETIPKSDGGSLLPAFPATLDTFLRTVVNAKTLADSTNRFRDFLRNNSVTETEANRRMAKLADEGFTDPELWKVTALEYRDWWESRESSSAGKPAENPKSAGKPAEAPMPSPKTALPTFETFLRTVVKGETDADSEKRFCAFLRSKFPESEADARLASLSKEGFKDLGSWLETSREYRDWCKSEK